jgi:hypothetical protein
MSEDLRHPIYVTAAPCAIDKLAKIGKALTVLYGKDLTMTNPPGVFAFWTPGKECPCRKCHEDLERIIEWAPDIGWWTGTGMIVCPDCGNKRCPQAASHEFWCTGSNATEQVYSFKDLDPNPRA